MFGNKTKMSRDQTKFVEAVQAKGWQVERGLQRVNNPDYQNFKTEAELKGLQVNRFTDEKIFQAEKVINQARLEQEKSLKFFKESQNKLADLESKHQQFDKKVEILGGIKDEKDKDITQKVIQERGLLDNSGTWHSVLEILLSKIQEVNQQQSEKLASVVDRSIKNDKKYLSFFLMV